MFQTNKKETYAYRSGLLLPKTAFYWGQTKQRHLHFAEQNAPEPELIGSTLHTIKRKHTYNTYSQSFCTSHLKPTKFPAGQGYWGRERVRRMRHMADFHGTLEHLGKPRRSHFISPCVYRCNNPLEFI